MKKRYMILAGLLAVSVAAAGCGKKGSETTEQTKQEAQVTVTPAAEKKETKSSEVVDMQKSTDETSGITNIIGEKTATAAQVVLINKTGDEVSAIYVRPYSEDSDDDEWGDELVNGKFTLKNGEKALYYYDKSAKDDAGNAVTRYDIRISYTDEEKNECFFRQLPLTSMTQLSLCMDGTGEDAIPYARYLSGTSKKEVSTLNDVKKRLGLSDTDATDEKTETDSTDTSDSTAGTVTPTTAPTDGGNDDAQNPHDDLNNQPADPVTTAESFIGQSLADLIAACGNPTGNEYENEPETGETGYHYYDTFTVSTTVDEEGNEIVAGVW